MFWWQFNVNYRIAIVFRWLNSNLCKILARKRVCMPCGLRVTRPLNGHVQVGTWPLSGRIEHMALWPCCYSIGLPPRCPRTAVSLPCPLRPHHPRPAAPPPHGLAALTLPPRFPIVRPNTFSVEPPQRAANLLPHFAAHSGTTPSHGPTLPPHCVAYSNAAALRSPMLRSWGQLYLHVAWPMPPGPLRATRVMGRPHAAPYPRGNATIGEHFLKKFCHQKIWCQNEFVTE